MFGAQAGVLALVPVSVLLSLASVRDHEDPVRGDHAGGVVDVPWQVGLRVDGAQAGVTT